jgi:hypothetical protein
MGCFGCFRAEEEVRPHVWTSAVALPVVCSRLLSTTPGFCTRRSRLLSPRVVLAGTGTAWCGPARGCAASGHNEQPPRFSLPAGAARASDLLFAAFVFFGCSRPPGLQEFPWEVRPAGKGGPVGSPGSGGMPAHVLAASRAAEDRIRKQFEANALARQRELQRTARASPASPRPSKGGHGGRL